MKVESSHIRRLAFIKYLYNLGVSQSYQPEPANASSILIFHDAVELFLQLTSEIFSVGRSDINFMEYWDFIGPKLSSGYLPQKEAMRRLNKTRGTLKHAGSLPSKMDIESFRNDVSAFFKDSTPLIYEKDFDEISLVDFVESESVRSHLKQAVDHLGEDKTFESVIEIAIAFRELIRSYEEQMRTIFGLSPIDFRTRGPFHTMRDLGFGLGKGPLLANPDIQRHFASYIEWVNESIDQTQQVVRMLAMGIDYPRYVRFHRYTPRVHLTPDGEYETNEPDTSTTPEQAQFCIDFVIEVAFKIQQSLHSLEPAQNLTVK